MNNRATETALDRALAKISLTFASEESKYDDIPEVLTRGECRALRSEIDRLRGGNRVKPAPLNDMWRVDVAGVSISVRGEAAKDHLEAVVRQMARMKLALHKLKWEEGSVGETARAGLS